MLLACQVVPAHYDLARHTVARAVARLRLRNGLRRIVQASHRSYSGSINLRDVVRPFGPLPFRPFRLSRSSLALSLFALYRVLCPAALLPCWCVLPVRLVFLCVPHAQACRKLRGTRDTTPDLCRSLCCLPRLHPSWRRCRASCWSRSIELSCFTRRPAGRDRVAVVQRARGERAMAGIALRDQKEMVQRGPSLRFMTCASERKSLSAGAFSAASLPASA